MTPVGLPRSHSGYAPVMNHTLPREGAPTEPPERLTPAEEPERLTPTEVPGRLVPDDVPEAPPGPSTTPEPGPAQRT